MGGLAITMFAGITALAMAAHVHMAESASDLIGLPAGAEQKTALSQIGLATFGQSAPFYLLQGFTAAILVLAANTAFNGFPVLASLLGRDSTCRTSSPTAATGWSSRTASCCSPPSRRC